MNPKLQAENLRHEAANRHFLREDVPVDDYSVILELIATHQTEQVPRLKKLHRYYAGRNDGILERKGRKGEDKADYRAAHPFAENITTFRTSYLVGKPVKIEFRDKDEDYSDLNTWVDRWNVEQNVDTHHLDLVTDLSKFGRAYELLNYSTDDVIHLAVSDPYHTFVVYDESTEQKPLYAVRYPTIVRNENDMMLVTVYTKTDIWYFEPIEVGASQLTEPEKRPHKFDDIPIIEYSANRFRTGDYEKVLTNIDLYDHAQSDTGNYMTDTNESMLVISGDFYPSRVEYNKDANMLLLPTGMTESGQQSTLNAQYIYPQYDVAGVESYKNRLRTDIYLFTYTPDVSDENFGGQQTGVALKYKLIGLEQDRAIKERLIRKGLSRRYRMLTNQAKVVVTDFNYEVNVNDMVVTFTPNLPANVAEELQTLVNAGAQFSQQTLLSLASFVDNVQDELASIAEEKQSTTRLQQVMEQMSRMTDDAIVGEADGEE